MNYDLEMQSELSRIGNARVRLLLHSCCAPCSIPALTRLGTRFKLTLFSYNPNIYPDSERELRVNGQRRLLTEAPFAQNASLIVPKQDYGEFLDAVRGLENEPEGGARCRKCFELRLSRCAREAREQGFDYIASTITTGPRKDAAAVNELGARAAEENGVRWLFADFKKRGGYQESAALSKTLGIYRQDYCGCGFSRRERDINRKDENH